MSEKTPQSSNQEAATEKQHTDAEFRRWCRAVGLCADEIARIVSETAVNEPVEAARARGGVHTR